MPRVVALLVFLMASGLAAAEPRLPLDRGAYRIPGQCTSMMHLSEEVDQCQPFVAIIVTSPEETRFIFARKDGGAWFFDANATGQLDETGKVQTWRVSSILQLAAVQSNSRIFKPYEGECSVDTRNLPAQVSCTLWRDTAHAEVAWHASVKGKGVTIYSPQLPPGS